MSSFVPDQTVTTSASVPTHRLSSRRFIVGLMTGVLLLLPASGARAIRHIRLVSSNPAKDSHVMSPVREIRLAFSGKIAVATASVELLAADSSRVKLGALTAVSDSDHVAVAKVTETLKNGTYTVQWKAVAADGAAGTGSFNFMYMAAKPK